LDSKYDQQNPKDIAKQVEFSSNFQQCKALMDIQIGLFGHWVSMISIQDFDNRLVKTGLVILDMLLCGSLHQQEA